MSCDKPAIQVSNIGKCFRIYRRPQDRLKQFLLPQVQKIIGMKQTNQYNEYWALKDISFQIDKGQAVGIIGRNGSGKSTLLQIIAGTMSPTTGNVSVDGRVAALLELGSGFNPQFTGRENVYLNGHLLGLTTKQIDDKFDDIVAFADIGEYLEQPVKTYSSGMMLRLAFSVQIAIEANILIVDEALAVGDAKFQLKCFRRLEEIKDKGTTILFVSHAIDMVKSFCNLGLVLNNGKAIFWGDAKTASIKYFEILFPEQHEKTNEKQQICSEQIIKQNPDSSVNSISFNVPELKCQTFGVGGAELNALTINGLDTPNLLVGGKRLVVGCNFTWETERIKELIENEGYENNITLGIAFADFKGKALFGCNGFDKEMRIDSLKENSAFVEFDFIIPFLYEGDYFLIVAIALGNLKHHIQLKWYDGLVQLKCLKSDKNIFGVFAIDYQIKKQSIIGEIINE